MQFDIGGRFDLQKVWSQLLRIVGTRYDIIAAFRHSLDLQYVDSVTKSVHRFLVEAVRCVWVVELDWIQIESDRQFPGWMINNSELVSAAGKRRH